MTMESLNSQDTSERKLINMPPHVTKSATVNGNVIMPTFEDNNKMWHNSPISTHSHSHSNSNSNLHSHQYHYIQYYQQHNNPMSMACQCSCSCGNQQQLQSQKQQQQQQQQQHQQQSSYEQHLHQLQREQQQESQHQHQHQHQHHSPEGCNNHNILSNQIHHGNENMDNCERVAVIVHRQASGSVGSSSVELSNTNNHNHNNSDMPLTKAQSETSLLNHSYQALKMSESLNEKLFNSVTNLKTGSSCDCDLECTCDIAVNNRKNTKQYALADVMLTADEITVSESDNNSGTVKRCERNHSTKKLLSKRGSCHDSNYNNTNNIDIYSDGEINDIGDGDIDCTVDSCLKEKNGIPCTNVCGDVRPPLPPRPPPRPQTMTTNSNSSNSRHGSHSNCSSNSIKKYVIWCLICGGFSCILGLLFLGVYFLLHSYTITVGNFETVPTFVPATLLILTGICIMSLARRRNRYSYLIKLSGVCGLISALTCALVTVTTTVLHMSRLQALRECEYAQKTRTCTCYSDMIESQVDRVDKEGVRLVFDSLSDCGIVHGSLYSCLRAIFGLSVAGVLVAVFSCMLVYQLLSHERKKMYWEQLELRCRSLYTRQQMPTQNIPTVGGTRACRCCEQCHAHRQVPLQTVAYPWDENGEPRFWSTQPPGNFYSPNPVGDDLNICRTHDLPNSRNRGNGWSWNRWWQRASPNTNSRYRQTPSSPDSQYGFTNTNAINEDIPNSLVQSTSHPSFNVIPGNLPYGVWGPPPPYSDPNSPARRVFYQYLQGTHAHAHNNISPMNSNLPDTVHPDNFIEQSAVTSNCCPQTAILRSVPNAVGKMSAKGDYENTLSDSDCTSTLRERDRFSNTLPSRKIKKRLDPCNKSIGPNSHNTVRVSAQQIFSNTTCRNDEHNYQQIQNMNAEGQQNTCGMENTGFKNSNENTNSGQSADEPSQPNSNDPTESEVYFADVSSCCNVSVKNDHYYEDAKSSQRTLVPMQQSSHHSHRHQHQHQHPHQHQHQHQHQLNHQHQHISENCSSSKTEDYLAQRFGERENSMRSRLPFPQNNSMQHNGTFVDKLQIISNNGNNKPNSDNQTNNHQQISKDISRQSMCSLDSEAKTEFTDLSPSTPCSGKLTQTNDFNSDIDRNTNNMTTNFVATYPYSSESQSLEAHKRSTKNLTETHYEIIDDNTKYDITAPIASRSNLRTPNKLHNAKTIIKTENNINSDREWLSDVGSNDRKRL